MVQFKNQSQGIECSGPTERNHMEWISWNDWSGFWDVLTMWLHYWTCQSIMENIKSIARILSGECGDGLVHGVQSCKPILYFPNVATFLLGRIPHVVLPGCSWYNRVKGYMYHPGWDHVVWLRKCGVPHLGYRHSLSRYRPVVETTLGYLESKMHCKSPCGHIGIQ